MTSNDQADQADQEAIPKVIKFMLTNTYVHLAKLNYFYKYIYLSSNDRNAEL